MQKLISKRGPGLRLLCAAAAVGTVAVPQAAHAVFRDWNVASGSWNLSTNWLQNVIPTAAEDVSINRPFYTPFTINFTADSFGNEIRVGDNNTTFDLGGYTVTGGGDLRIGAIASQAASLTLQNGTVSAAGVNVGDFASGSGVLNVSDGVVLNASNNLNVGSVGTGQVNLSGGAINVTGVTTVFAIGTLGVTGGSLTTGSLNTSAGTLNFTSGAITVRGGMFKPKQQSVASLSLGLSPDSFAVSGVAGSSARPTLTLTAGATMALANNSNFNNTDTPNYTGGSIFFGVDGGKGGATVSGSTSSLMTSNTVGQLLVGVGGTKIGSTYYPGDGTLALADGGRARAYFNTLIGGNGGTARVTVDGNGSSLTTTNGYLNVGFSRYGSNSGPQSDGTLMLTNGGQASCTLNASIGISGGTGRVTIDGSGSRLTTTNGYLYVGAMGNALTPSQRSDGTLALTHGGQASSTSIVLIGYLAAVGRVTVDGEGSELASTNSAMYVGFARRGASAGMQGDGTLTLTRGGRASVYSDALIGYSGGAGRVIVDGVGATASMYDVGRDLYVGSVGYSTTGDTNGQLTLTAGGSVKSGSLAGGNAFIGTYRCIGTVDVSSATSDASTWTHTGDAFLGSNGTTDMSNRGTGTLTVGTGGLVSISGALNVYASDSTTPGASGGTLNLNGGTLAVGTFNGVTPGDFNFTGGTLKITNGGLSIGATTAFGAAATLGTGKTLDIAQTTTIESGSTLAVSGGLLKTGALAAGGAVTLTGGTVQVATSANAPAITGPGGVDVRGGLLKVAYSGTSPVAAVRDLLSAGYAEPAKFATGLVRSTTAGANIGLGYGDDGAVVTIRSTVYGDATLDGVVNFNDFLVLQAKFGQSGTRFDEANFDYDGYTDFNDFLILQANFGQTVNGTPSAVTAGEIAALTAFAAANAPVPEPAMAGLVGVSAVLALGRRRSARAASF